LRALHRPTPAYPADALREGIHNGRVLASFVVNPDGSVSAIQIVSAAPARAFDRAVRGALAQWRFAPVAAATPASVEFAFDVNRN
jgi:protein TonB